jgi:hypothetical protein
MLPATFRINRHESPQQYLCNFQCQAGKSIIMRSFIAGPLAPVKSARFLHVRTHVTLPEARRSDVLTFEFCQVAA